MRYKIGSIALLALGGILLSLPLEAQLAEAGRVAWPGFNVLKGHWRAIESGEVIDINQINPRGRMEAQCSNPESVQVSKAQAARDGQATRVFIGLREPDSVGCSYDLTYDPGNDQLRGVLCQKAKNTGVVFSGSSKVFINLNAAAPGPLCASYRGLTIPGPWL